MATDAVLIPLQVEPVAAELRQQAIQNGHHSTLITEAPGQCGADEPKPTRDQNGPPRPGRGDSGQGVLGQGGRGDCHEC